MASHDHWVFQRAVLWSAELHQRHDSPFAAHVPATFCHIHGDAIDQLMETVRQMDAIQPHAIAKRLEQGKQCFAMQVDKTIAAYGWLTCGPEWVGELERELHVLEDEAYIWDCATLPIYRRQRLFSALICCIMEQLARDRLRQLWIIANNSAPSLVRNMKAVGFVPVVNLTYLRLMGVRILITNAHVEASSQQINDARRLLKGEHDRIFGPLMIGNSSRQRPPDTHFDPASD